MERTEIIEAVGTHADFFRGQWAQFGGRMEGYAVEFRRLVAAAEAEYSEQLEAALPSTQKAIGEAQKMLIPAWEKMRAAGDRLAEVKKVWRPKAIEIADEAQRRYMALPEAVRAADKDSRVPLPEAQAIYDWRAAEIAKHQPLFDELNEAKDHEEKCVKEYEDVKARTDPGYYCSPATDARKRKPGAEYRWVEYRDPGLRDFLDGMPGRFSPFWLPDEVRNPVGWFGIGGCPDVDLGELSPDDQGLRAAVILAVVRDDYWAGRGAVDRICKADDDGMFLADEFVEALANRLREPDADNEIFEAWNRVGPLLPKSKATPTEQDEPENPDDEAPATAEVDQPKLYSFGQGYRSVNWYGDMYSFTSTQAAVVEILAQAYEAGTPDVDAELLVGSDAFTQEAIKGKQKRASAAKRVRDIFRSKGKMHDAWDIMLAPGGTRGTYCLKKPQ